LLSTSPVFVVADLQRSVDFYCRVLGFGEPGIWGEPPCFAMVNRNLFDLMLSLATSPEQVRPNGPNGVWDMYLKVDDITAEQRAIQAAGVKLERGPEKTFYSIIEIEILDPDRYRICLGQEVGEG